MKRTLSIVCLLATSILSPAVEKVYVACSKLGIRVADFNSETGELSPLNEAVSLSGAGFIALHPEKPILYATCSGEGEKGDKGEIAALKIIEDGALDVINRSKTRSGGACHLSVDATGKVVFAASYGTGSVASFQVKEDGSLSDAVSFFEHEGSSVHPKRQTRSHAHYIAAGPKNAFAYVPDLGLDEVKIYRFEEDTAKLIPEGEAKLAGGAGPRHMKFSKDGKFAYVLNELNITVTTFSYNEEDGTLSEVATISAVPEGTGKEELSCAEIRVHPNGKFVYTSQRDLRTRGSESALGRNSISVYRVSEEGIIQRVQTISAGVRIPRNFNLDPTGKWLLAGGQASQDVQVFSVDEKTGKVTPVR